MALHHAHSIEKKQAAAISLLASGGLAGAKFVIALTTGSLALLTEALHSLLDLAATAMTYFAVHWGDRPADPTHHYGHGKIESLAALVEVIFLFIVATFATWEAIDRLSGHPHPVEVTFIAIAIISISVVVDFFRARALSRTAKETSSQALEADSLHFASDMWASLAALGGLVGIWLGFAEADAIAALVVAALIVWISIGLGRRTIDTLLDAAPAGSRELVEKLAASVGGVVKVERVRVRPVGAQNFCEIAIQVARTLPLARVDEIKQRVAQAVRYALPNADVIISSEAVALGNETIMERVRLIAARQQALIHHLTVQQLDDKLAIGLDLEIDGTLPFHKAHHAATRLEESLQEEFGPQTEVETHMEPLQTGNFIGHAAPEPERAAIENHVKQLVANHPQLRNIHALRLRLTEAGRIVVLHCHVAPDLSVRAVHEAVDALERDLRVQHPDIIRILIHAEPLQV